MPIYGKFQNAFVREVELLDENGNLNSDEFTLHTFGLIQPNTSTARSIASSLSVNYDQTTSNPHYVHYLRSYLAGGGFGAPWGILIKKKLKPGEIMTISGYFVRGESGVSGDGQEPISAETGIRLLYENRPGEMQSFTREGETLSSDGLTDEGMGLVLPPTGKNVCIVSPWEYSSGESYGDYFPARNSADTGYETTCNLFNVNIHSPTASEGYPRYYRIRIGNDSENEAAIKIMSMRAAIEESLAAVAVYKLKVRVEKSPQYLDSARIGITGDINFRDVCTEVVYAGYNSLSNEPHNIFQMFLEHSSAYTYSWMVRSLNGYHTKAGTFSLPIGGTDAYSDHVAGLLYAYNFEDGTQDVVPAGWITNTGDNTGPRVKTKSDNSNKILALCGAVDQNVQNPPHSQSVAGNRGWRWVQLQVGFTYPIRVYFQAYEPIGAGDPYGLTNDPEADWENLYLQYKVGASGTWTTLSAATKLAGQHTEDLSTTHSYSLSFGQSDTNPLYLRWIAYTEHGVGYDQWGIDGIQVVDLGGSTGFRARTNRVFAAPNDGEVSKVCLKWQNAFTGPLYVKVVKLDASSNINDMITGTELESMVISSYGRTVSNSTSLIINPWDTIPTFTRGDVLGLIIQTGASTHSSPTTKGLGSILGTCVLRFKNETLRVVT